MCDDALRFLLPFLERADLPAFVFLFLFCFVFLLYEISTSEIQLDNRWTITCTLKWKESQLELVSFLSLSILQLTDFFCACHFLEMCYVVQAGPAIINDSVWAEVRPTRFLSLCVPSLSTGSVVALMCHLILWISFVFQGPFISTVCFFFPFTIKHLGACDTPSCLPPSRSGALPRLPSLVSQSFQPSLSLPCTPDQTCSRYFCIHSRKLFLEEVFHLLCYQALPPDCLLWQVFCWF